jgi:hypothetical protein
MKNSFQIFWLFCLISILSSCGNETIQNSNSESLELDIEFKLDTVKLVFQNFAGGTLINKFDTQIVHIKEFSERRIISHFDAHLKSNRSIEISKKMNRYMIQKMPISQNVVCNINQTDSTFSDLGIILFGSCSLKPEGKSYPDTGGKSIYSTLFGLIVSKGTFCQCGTIIYSINEDKIPEDEKVRLLHKI